MRPESIKWQSKKFQEWLRRKDCTFCGKPLEQDGLTWELHHANHKRNSSAFYALMCRTCHSSYHLNESVFNRNFDMNKDEWYLHCMRNMILYVDFLGIDTTMICLKALADAAEENE